MAAASKLLDETHKTIARAASDLAKVKVLTMKRTKALANGRVANVPVKELTSNYFF
jgi:hypothetical protein